jgi:isocitrate dehydrogenase kinase/phosphatase
MTKLERVLSNNSVFVDEMEVTKEYIRIVTNDCYNQEEKDIISKLVLEEFNLELDWSELSNDTFYIFNELFKTILKEEK